MKPGPLDGVAESESELGWFLFDEDEGRWEDEGWGGEDNGLREDEDGGEDDGWREDEDGGELAEVGDDEDGGELVELGDDEVWGEEEGGRLDWGEELEADGAAAVEELGEGGTGMNSSKELYAFRT